MNTFNFADLPFLSQKRVLELGEPALRLNLSYLSSRMEKMVRESRVKTREMVCVVKERENRIFVRGEERHLNMHFKRKRLCQKEEEEELNISGKYLLSRLTKFRPDAMTQHGSEFYTSFSHDIPSSLKNTLAVMNWMLGLLRPLRLRWKFDVVSNEDVKRLMSFPPFENAYIVEMKGGELNSEALSALIDHLKSAEYLVIQCKLPLDFHHNQPFRFPIVTYKEARWVTLEHLLPMNFCRLNLGETNIGSCDLNKFLNEWISKDCETVQSLTIMRLKEDIDWKTVMHGTRSLYFLDDETPTRLIMAKNEKNRVGKLGRISSDDHRKFYFSAEPESEYPGKKALLQLLHLRAELEETTKFVSMNHEEFEKLEWDTEEKKERVKTIRISEPLKRDLDRQLREVSRKLELRNVEFSQGMAMIR